MTRVLRVLGALALVGYPVLVWKGLETQSPRHVALLMLVVLVPVAALRLRRLARATAASGEASTTSAPTTPMGHLKALAVVPFISVISLVLASLLDSQGLIQVVPVAINGVFLTVFGWTLRAGSMPIVERFARLQTSELNDEQAAWCRMWTQLWCAFFVLNGSIAAITAVAMPVSWWAFYNGMIAYALIGSMFAAEYVLRHRRFPELRERAPSE